MVGSLRKPVPHDYAHKGKKLVKDLSIGLGTANNSQRSVYQQPSPAPPSEMTVEIPAKTYMEPKRRD
ncbi:hypothetical protein STEG23_030909 [Scotinomys teguina]